MSETSNKVVGIGLAVAAVVGVATGVGVASKPSPAQCPKDPPSTTQMQLIVPKPIISWWVVEADGGCTPRYRVR